MQNTNDMIVDHFQLTVEELLVRNKSIVDQITKFQDSSARVNRAVVKAATQCGCININAHKQIYKPDADFDEFKESMETHLSGKLCDNCRDAIEKEMGSNLFFLTSLCNTLDLNLYDIVIKELDRVKLLGKYNMR